MRIVTVRRISQIFFFVLFLWFCLVTTIGGEWWRLRGWPVNLFLQLDPLVAIGTALTTHSLYWPLLWALPVVALTIILGRFFCSWVCPFGSVHHFVGFLAYRKKNLAEKVKANRYRKGQCIKYFILIFFLILAALPLAKGPGLQIGLLDPISLMSRSVNLVLLPVIDNLTGTISVSARFYEGAWLILTIFFAAVFLNLLIPRFYCRFICPLGALFGIIGRFAIWRIGKKQIGCPDCKMCERACQGACAPSAKIRISECVLCFNCLQDCANETISYQTRPSLAGEITNPDITRRGFMLSAISGVFALPAIRLGNLLGSNYYYRLIRPPGALPEEEFLQRCIKCGQCMRICPTNVIQPGGLQPGFESLWTPVLNMRIGSSGCQLNCTACGYICPTSAIRPISLSEKLGLDDFAQAGPIKMGTAFVDRSRCLPWAMDKPCIVCQENCPVSPKAIYTRTSFETVRDGILTVKKAVGGVVETIEDTLVPDQFSTGDYYCLLKNGERRKIETNTENTIVVSSADSFERIPVEGEKIEIQIRLQRPYVDIHRCIGCGVCEHECPVSGRRAIRVSAEGETRSRHKSITPKGQYL